MSDHDTPPRLVKQLVGVYNADGGLKGEVRSFLGATLGGAHCALCDITHSPVRRRRAWDAYVAALPIPLRLVHRNERTPAEHLVSDGHEPCVLAEFADGHCEILISATHLAQVASVDQFAMAVTDNSRSQNLVMEHTTTYG